MRTARSALEYARQVATLLGPAWTAASCGHADLAILKSPSTSLEIATETPVRASSPVTVTLSTPHTLTWPKRSDLCQKVTGTIGNPQALADAIRTTGFPAWNQLLAELEKRTALTHSELKAFVAVAQQLPGPEAQVSYGSRPGVADLKWPGGRAIIHADEDSVCVRHVDLSDLTASGFAGVLRAARTKATT
ncbi:hypothetical protein [Streptomyces noursei]|uniref:hypothetical protein n=1 Tax=Streptomyces noursei TaxID=1971 RepID=UPI0016753351|nr:hypothetical protein [Streptomyces noursei]MCZ1019724.1 hypothetical protein [Streptomyces noursei]GGX51018.1 hypothetical protein GCM10010341_85750 [Streptomyces noursei]